MKVGPCLDLTAPLHEVLDDLNVELRSCYTMKARGAWPWLLRRGRVLHVDLLPAAEFWLAAGRRQVSMRLLQRACALLNERGAYTALVARLNGEEVELPRFRGQLQAEVLSPFGVIGSRVVHRRRGACHA